MDVYFMRDREPQGGFFAIYTGGVPVMSEQPRRIIEVRKGSFPDKILKKLDQGGDIIPDPITHYDELIIPYWEKAEAWWTREGGYVNGTE